MRRPNGRPRSRLAPTWGLLVIPWLVGITRADDPKPKSVDRPKAPGDSVIFDRDQAGATFIARPLKEQYDGLQKRVAALKEEIRAAKIEPAQAREQILALQGGLAVLMEKIQATKLYIPGAAIKTVTETSTVPIAADDLLFVEAEDVEIRGWDRPEIRVVLEKTVLDEDGTKFAADLGGIELVSRKGSGREFFGYYVDILRRPGGRAEWDRFPFPEFVQASFPYLAIKGLTYEEGNRSIEMKMESERGESTHSSQMRRHAKLVLNVPKCRKVAVRGARGTFKVRDLDASLAVLGQGDTNFSTSYEVANLGGSLTAEDLPIHRLDGIKGSVSIVATAYVENRSTSAGRDGTWNRSDGPRPSSYQNIQGDLTAYFCRADLALGNVTGRVDVRNDFGDTTWRIDAPVDPKAAHRVVSQGGSTTLRLDPLALGDLTLSLFTECGALRLARGVDGFRDRMFESALGDDFRHAWHAQVRSRGEAGRPDPSASLADMRRPVDALLGRERKPGVDVVSRAGTIVVLPAEGH